jgi:secondary thiamine-phosphate synthase enzyme
MADSTVIYTIFSQICQVSTITIPFNTSSPRLDRDHPPAGWFLLPPGPAQPPGGGYAIVDTMRILTVSSSQKRQVVDVTDLVSDVVSKAGEKDLVCHLFLRHTSAALTIADLDPGTDLDLLDAYEAMAPRLRYRHPHDPAHFPDHLWSSTVGVELNIPCSGGKLLLGQWQRIVMIEFDGPRKREIVAALTAAD